MSRTTDDELFDLGLDGGEGQVEYPRGTEILPEAPHLHGDNRRSAIHGSPARVVSGRSSSPKLFAQASLFPDCAQLRAWKLENGQPVGLGVIEAEASEEDFVNRFATAMPQPGQGKATFRLRPVGLDGRELGQEFSLLISEHHSALHRSVPGSGNTHNSMMESGVPGQMIDMLRDTLTASQLALEAERARTQELLQQMAQERIDLASNATTSVQTISERMLEADASRHEQILRSEQQRNQQSQSSMQNFFKSNLEVLQAERDRSEQLYNQQQERDRVYHHSLIEGEKLRQQKDKDEANQRYSILERQQERERERQSNHFQMMLEQERQRRERDAQEFRERMELLRQQNAHKRQMESEEYERKERDRRRQSEEKRDRDRRDQKEREAERNRLHSMKMKELELAAQRDREHAERMMQLQALQVQKESGATLRDSLKEGMEMLQGFGIEPMDLIQKMVGGDEGTSTGTEILGSITKIAEKFGDVAKEHVKAQAKVKTSVQQSRMQRQRLAELEMQDLYLDDDLDELDLREPVQNLPSEPQVAPPAPPSTPSGPPPSQLPLKPKNWPEKPCALL